VTSSSAVSAGFADAIPLPPGLSLVTNAQAAERPSSSGPARLGDASDGTKKCCYPAVFRALRWRDRSPAPPAATMTSARPARIRSGSGIESELVGLSLSMAEL
jgi:hypothetical protein